MTRSRWIYNKQTGKMEPLYQEQKDRPNAPFVHKDEVDAFENPVTGKMETSMSTYRRNLREQGYFEKGNDRMKFELPSFDKRYGEVRESVLEAERQIKWGMAKSTTEEREQWNKKR